MMPFVRNDKVDAVLATRSLSLVQMVEHPLRYVAEVALAVAPAGNRLYVPSIAGRLSPGTLVDAKRYAGD